jgi:hypothetical protein
VKIDTQFVFYFYIYQSQKSNLIPMILMKKALMVISGFTLAFGLLSCGGKKAGDDTTGNDEVTKVKNTLGAVGAMATVGKEMKKENEVAQAKIKERRAKGDTLAIPYADLMKYLPASIDGYKAGEPDGSTVNMPGASYSAVNVNFKNDKGDHVKVTLMDYNAAYGLYSSVTALWTMGMSIDSPEEKANGVKFDGEIGGWEDYHKKSKAAQLTLGIGYRFWLQVEANNQESNDFIKSVAKSMDLAKLSNL